MGSMKDSIRPQRPAEALSTALSTAAKAATSLINPEQQPKRQQQRCSSQLQRQESDRPTGQKKRQQTGAGSSFELLMAIPDGRQQQGQAGQQRGQQQ